MSDTPNRIEEIPVERLSPRQNEVLNKLMSGRGRIPTPFKIWLHSPELADRLQSLGKFLSDGTSLSKREAEIAILCIAAHWHGDYVFTVHAREARDAGLPDAAIEGIGSQRAPLLEHPREQVVYQLASNFGAREPISNALFAQATDELGHAGLAELLALCGYFTTVALAMKTYAV